MPLSLLKASCPLGTQTTFVRDMYGPAITSTRATTEGAWAMKTFKIVWLFAGIVSLGCLVCDGEALGMQDRQAGAGLAPLGPVPGQSLNDASLEATLRSMGYDPKISKSSNGKRTFYRLHLEEDKFRFVFDLSLDTERERIWFSGPLSTVTDRDRVATERLWKLLESNDDISPVFFSYDNNNKRVYLNLVIDNRDMTATILRKEISRFMRVTERTYPLWKDMQPAPAPSNPPPATPAVPGM